LKATISSPFSSVNVSAPRAASLVAAAAKGDERAWGELVDRFGGLVWSVARSYRLSEADAADVSQTTWLRLAEHLGRLREPDLVGAWLATTARREALRVIRRASRVDALPEEGEWADASIPAPESGLVDDERRAALWAAFAGLSERCRTLLRVLLADPEPSYEEVSTTLGMPVGSIGPTRARCLDELRRSREIARISHGAGDSP
jgi:RNA polymerase sigma factor (sigma-70 family)